MDLKDKKTDDLLRIIAKQQHEIIKMKKQSTEDIRQIYNNVQFWFYIIVVPAALYLIFLIITTPKIN